MSQLLFITNVAYWITLIGIAKMTRSYWKRIHKPRPADEPS